MAKAGWVPLPQCRLQPGLGQPEVTDFITAIRVYVQNSQRIALVENEHFIAGPFHADASHIKCCHLIDPQLSLQDKDDTGHYLSAPVFEVACDYDVYFL